ncbi:hypothetical protein GCM10010193_18560 [Kitasatospora atroaurantiaca]|uniref:Golgi phosphoprotein 3 GPP34 n=1 Tax=Kitasatospora atroaurantiaca TaxID=285545 RepID=A0A561EPB8_9ACTN|nr:GPP34 family phosphoprotein [Kitasatospora atroaurantiaca]TWE17450.1 Golgi phosphoprotein 3 GPP34 [Kitasatospora atroaurantiaca]
MDVSDTLPIPEELLLLCADPVTGRLARPASFARVIAGGVLAELLLAGAITVDGRRISGYQPLGTTEPVAAGVLTRLAGAGKRSWRFRLASAITAVPRGSEHVFLDSLAARGLVTAEPRRLFGIFPYRRFTATGPGPTQAIASRLWASLHTAAFLAETRPAVERDRQLAALLGVVSLERRLFPGPEGKEVRHAVRALSRTLPIARAVRSVISSDSSSAGSSG